jgi:hypothetical protein
VAAAVEADAFVKPFLEFVGPCCLPSMWHGLGTDGNDINGRGNGIKPHQHACSSGTTSLPRRASSPSARRCSCQPQRQRWHLPQWLRRTPLLYLHGLRKTSLTQSSCRRPPPLAAYQQQRQHQQRTNSSGSTSSGSTSSGSTSTDTDAVGDDVDHRWLNERRS